MTIKTPNPSTITEAANILKNGGLVGLPTETVYGLAANALDDSAVAKIFAAKGRPSFNPLIIHVPDVRAAEELVHMNEAAYRVAQAFWPGPLTLILPRKTGCGVSELASAGLETLAVRVPAHPVALAVLKAAGVPLAAPSANLSGSLSPTTPAHVAESLGSTVDLILAAGACAVGLESTVLDLSGSAPVILRAGAVTAEDLEAILGVPVSYETSESPAPKSPIKSPGLLLKHYAPNTPLRLNAVDVKEGEALLAFGSPKFMGLVKPDGQGGFAARDLPETHFRNLSEDGDLHEAAANLFAMLKMLDNAGARGIAVMPIPHYGLGIAINDRLKRGAEKG